MAGRSLLILGFAIASTVWASPSRVPLEPDVAPHNPETSSWKLEERAPADHEVQLTVALRVDAGARAALEQFFWEVSDPDHERYGEHLDIDGVTKLLAVPAERVERVRGHFLAAGATKAVVAPNRDMITVSIPVSAAEALLDTTLHFFSHLQSPSLRLLRAARGYSLPAEVAKDVVMVADLLQFPLLQRPLQQDNVGGAGQWPNDCSADACKGLVTPGVLNTRYKLGNQSSEVVAAASNKMAVAEFQGQHYVDADIKAFGTSCHRDVTVAENVGGNTPATPGVEAELDIEYIKAVAPEIPLTVVYANQYSLLNWANQISSAEDTPKVHSVSYGNDEKQQSGVAFMDTCNTAFMKAGARGISILFASGDQGVCGREGCGIFRFRFKPDFPGGSPYITVVGGTDFKTFDIGDECAWINGGGGFSDTFGIPAYQAQAVAAYKASPDANMPPQKYWNGTGRGYPDVAALGGVKTPYCIYSGSRWGGVAGTSAACPVVAGVFAKLNGLRVAKGGAPMGFLNPFIYKNPSGFQDVTCGINKATRNYGFTAVKGWDAATGFGTPDFEALSKLALQTMRLRTAEAVPIVV